MPLEIRAFDERDDLEALTQLIHRAYAAHLAAGLRYWGTHQSVADTEERIRSGQGFVMVEDHQYVGTITVRPPYPQSTVPLYRRTDVFTLAQFCVSPERQGQRLGRRLHDHAVAYAASAGASTIALDTAKPADRLIKLYESWGYQLVGECDWRPHTNYESVVMSKAARAGAA
jgi:predicted N-acetyltransferase YhbS